MGVNSLSSLERGVNSLSSLERGVHTTDMTREPGYRRLAVPEVVPEASKSPSGAVAAAAPHRSSAFT